MNLINCTSAYGVNGVEKVVLYINKTYIFTLLKFSGAIRVCLLDSSHRRRARA
jgi:hypothetical protein